MHSRALATLCRVALRWAGLCILLLAGAAASAQQTVRVGVYNFAPLVFIDEQQQARGLYVDVLEWVAKREGWTLEYVPGTWQENLDRLEAGQIDVLTSIISSEERLKKFDFTQQHLFLDWGLVFRPKGSSIETLFDLRGKTVAALKGSIYTTEFKKLLNQFEIPVRIVEKNEYSEVFKAIVNKEVDAGINGNVSGLKLESQYPVERTTMLFSPLKFRFASKKEASGTVLSTLDRHIQALLEDKNSVYYESYRKWTGLAGGSSRLPDWIVWTAAALIAGMAFLFGLSLLLKRQIRRKTMELARTKNYYKQILAASPVGILSYDASGQCLTVNEQAIRVLGTTQAQLLQQNFHQLASWKQSDLLERAQAALASGQINHTESHFRSPVGRDVWFDTIFTRFSADGKHHLIQLVTDITERKQAQERIREVSEELYQANEALESRVRRRTLELEEANAKLAASSQELLRSNQELEQFAYVASHDLQEPLRMVVGFVQLLEKRLAGQLDAESLEFMGFAVDGALRMQKLIQDILTYSRISSRAAPTEPVDSETAVREALVLLGNPIAQSGAVVDVWGLPQVKADRTQLVQLFQNLIGNAIKFCQAGQPYVRIEAWQEGAHWRFAVTDNGIGISVEYQDRIFGIFQRLHTRSEYPGTGIGLAVCKRIVQRHGGRIGVEPAPGGGSRFWFTLNEEKSP